MIIGLKKQEINQNNSLKIPKYCFAYYFENLCTAGKAYQMFQQYGMGDQSKQITYPVLKARQASFLPFTVSGIGDYICDKQYYVRRHGMEACLILYTLEGVGCIQYENKEFELTPGQMIIMDCRKYHYYATKEESWHFLWIHFEGKCAYDYVDILNEGGGVPIFIGGRISFQYSYKKMVSYASRFDRQGELENSAILQTLLTDLIGLKKTEEFSRKYGGYQAEMEASLSYLQEHFDEDLNIDRLAEECHLSKFYYIKVFKAYTRQTPYDYLVNLRLQKSQRLLLETEKSIGDIALETGFGDSKNYIACFKKRVGMTPLQYRKQRRI